MNEMVNVMNGEPLDADAPATARASRRSAEERQTVPVFQGGGALGAYQALAPLDAGRLSKSASSGMPCRCDAARVRPQGATLEHPGWKNGHVEWEPFPVEDKAQSHR